MRKPLCVLLLLVAPLLAAQDEEDAAEELLTGGELYQRCKGDSEESPPTAYCKEFVYGLVGVLTELQETQPESEQLFCIDPNRIGLEEVTLNVTDWLGRHPERHTDPAYAVVAEALSVHYPCPAREGETQPL